MARQKQTKKSQPHVFIKADSMLNIQVRYKERDPDTGKLVFKSSKNMTATGWTLDEAVEKIVAALKGV